MFHRTLIVIFNYISCSSAFGEPSFPLTLSSNLEEPPEWLLRPYVAPALRGLETIEEVVTPVSHEAPSTGPKYVSSRRRRDGGGGTRCFKPPPRPLPQQPSAAPLRMQSFNDAAVIEEICSNPTSDLAKFHLAAAQTRVRRQRAMLRKIKRRPGDVVTISEETERRFQTFILAAALGDDDDD
ncbi:unnamed protein product [Mesocestoides corti]|uniref:Uncharacterized protein n=1 Tax=Mesocestoides corti TaxID=53468 RepID=A0A0R3U7Y6_MESCO|nr:unnamed protein product [Mesocestoides corti]